MICDNGKHKLNCWVENQKTITLLKPQKPTYFDTKLFLKVCYSICFLFLFEEDFFDAYRAMRSSVGLQGSDEVSKAIESVIQTKSNLGRV